MKKLLLVIIFTIFSGVVLADSPPAWGEFAIVSANGKYIANIVIDGKENTKEPWNNKYRITISENASKKVLWSYSYDYDGYPEGLLSDDGTAFVYVNQWYRENYPVIYIYYKGLVVHKIAGDEFKINEKELKQTASHQLWLNHNLETKYRFLSAGNRLTFEIFTIDQRRFLIDVESGGFIKI
jgi:hypothetical protein